MVTRILAALSPLLVTLAAAAGEGPPHPGFPPPAATPGQGQLSMLTAEEQMAVPPGTPEDQARWRAGHEVNQRIGVELTVSSRLQWAGRNNLYAERLDALAGNREAPQAAKAADLLSRYRKVALDNWQLATAAWPVDKIRACQYPLLDLQSAMQPGGAARASTLLVARDNMDDCLGKARPVAQRLAELNRSLEGLQAEAESLLPPLAGTPGAAPPQRPTAR